MRLLPLKTSLQMILMQFYITATVKRSSHYSKKLLAVLAQLLVLLMLNQMSRFRERLVIERAISVNTAAAGGNASNDNV